MLKIIVYMLKKINNEEGKLNIFISFFFYYALAYVYANEWCCLNERYYSRSLHSID